MIFYRKGGDTSAGNIGDLFKAVSLSSDDVTCAGVRNDTGHGEPVCGQRSLREVLSEGECKGDGIRCYRHDAHGVRRLCSLPLCEDPRACLGVIGGPAMPERGWRSSSAILAKRLLT